MKFIWEDGTEMEYPVHASIRGVAKKGKRPISVSLSYRDIQQIVTAVHPEQSPDRYLHRIQMCLEFKA